MRLCRSLRTLVLKTGTTERGKTMNKLITALVAAFVLAFVAASALAAGKPIAFVGKYTGQATTQANDNVVTINAKGTGAGTLIGAGKITGLGTGDSSQRPCVPFTGTGSMTGTGGSLTFKVNPGSSGCGDDAGQLFSITGKATVLKGTGKLAKVKGTLKMTGTYDRTSGAFSVKFSGALTR
jgi:hypothetical protein